MKKVIELLERAEGAIMLATAGKPDSSDLELCTDAINYINDAMALLKAYQEAPRWETPEQWEKRTGEKYPGTWAVYYRCPKANRGRFVKKLGNICDYINWTPDIWVRVRCAANFPMFQVVCATEAGPPPDTWEPEEAGDV